MFCKKDMRQILACGEFGPPITAVVLNWLWHFVHGLLLSTIVVEGVVGGMCGLAPHMPLEAATSRGGRCPYILTHGGISAMGAIVVLEEIPTSFQWMSLTHVAIITIDALDILKEANLKSSLGTIIGWIRTGRPWEISMASISTVQALVHELLTPYLSGYLFYRKLDKFAEKLCKCDIKLVDCWGGQFKKNYHVERKQCRNKTYYGVWWGVNEMAVHEDAVGTIYDIEYLDWRKKEYTVSSFYNRSWDKMLEKKWSSDDIKKVVPQHT
ncbi:unnamed protein product [Cylicocyclus nassatus]|uniref:Uncharacterized protein n=1 Tax=Cylicocyclus nassatus TaxID=53992 RepID=A0AA36H1F3_CYLNA|nr:unnamed protein product [Cylicocyclus nassatus]